MIPEYSPMGRLLASIDRNMYALRRRCHPVILAHADEIYPYDPASKWIEDELAHVELYKMPYGEVRDRLQRALHAHLSLRILQGIYEALPRREQEPFLVMLQGANMDTFERYMLAAEHAHATRVRIWHIHKEQLRYEFFTILEKEMVTPDGYWSDAPGWERCRVKVTPKQELQRDGSTDFILSSQRFWVDAEYYYGDYMTSRFFHVPRDEQMSSWPPETWTARRALDDIVKRLERDGWRVHRRTWYDVWAWRWVGGFYG